MNTRKTAGRKPTANPSNKPTELSGEPVLRHEVQAQCLIALDAVAANELGPEATQALIDELDMALLTSVIQTTGHVFNLRLIGVGWVLDTPKPGDEGHEDPKPKRAARTRGQPKA